MGPVTHLSRLLAALFVTLVLGVTLAPAAAAATVAFTFSDSRITAPVGLAVDGEHRVYWTSNAGKSASTAIYAVAPDGSVAARLTYQLAATDTFAIAYDGGRVFVGDRQSAGTLQVSYVTPAATLANAQIAFRSWDFAYSDTKQVPVAILVGPATQLYVVMESGQIFAAPAQPSATATNRLTKVGDGPAGVVGGTFDAGSLILRTATELVAVEPTGFTVTARATTPEQAGARGVTGSLNDSQYMLSGQGVGSPVLIAPGPGAQGSGSPSVSASASGSGTAEPTAAASGESAAPIEGEKANQTGTLVAIGGAIVLALAAGVVTALRR